MSAPCSLTNVMPAPGSDVANIRSTQIAVQPPESETAAVLSMIERLAKDPTVDLDRVERMMALHREMRKEKALEAFNNAMSAIKAELPQVFRDAANPHTRSRYARLETISAAVDPIIAKHGLSLSFGTETSPAPHHYRVVCDVALGSHERRYFLDTPADDVGAKGNSNKTAVQAAGSALSYARRYLKLMIFDIALTNEDNDGNGARDTVPEPVRQRAPAPEPVQQVIEHRDPVITADQVMQLRDLLNEVGAPERDFLAWLKLKRLDDIPADVYPAAVEGAKNYKGGNRGRR